MTALAVFSGYKTDQFNVSVLFFQMLKKEEAIPWPGTLAIVHSYIAYKTGTKTLLCLENVFCCVGGIACLFSIGN